MKLQFFLTTILWSTLITNPVESLTASLRIFPDMRLIGKSDLQGVMELYQNTAQDPLRILVKIQGLPPNVERAWHVHELPVPSNMDCMATGGNRNT